MTFDLGGHLLGIGQPLEGATRSRETSHRKGRQKHLLPPAAQSNAVYPSPMTSPSGDTHGCASSRYPSPHRAVHAHFIVYVFREDSQTSVSSSTTSCRSPKAMGLQSEPCGQRSVLLEARRHDRSYGHSAECCHEEVTNNKLIAIYPKRMTWFGRRQ